MNIIVKILISVVMININYNLINDLKNRVFNILSNCNEIKLLKNFSIIHYKNNKKEISGSLHFGLWNAGCFNNPI